MRQTRVTARWHLLGVFALTLIAFGAWLLHPARPRQTSGGAAEVRASEPEDRRAEAPYTTAEWAPIKTLPFPTDSKLDLNSAAPAAPAPSTASESPNFRGTVVDDEGRPLAGATVTARAEGAPAESQRSSGTDAEGKFEISLDTHLEYAIFGSHPGYFQRERVSAHISFGEARIVLGRTATLKGSVLRDADVTPPPYAVVRGVASRADAVAHPSPSPPHWILPPEGSDLPFFARPLGKSRLTPARDETGHASYLYATPFTIPADADYIVAAINEDGSFSFPALPVGEARLEITLHPQLPPLVTLERVTVEASSASDQRISPIDLRGLLRPIRLTVIDSSGQRVQRASVRLLGGQPQRQIAEGWTASDGTWQFAMGREPLDIIAWSQGLGAAEVRCVTTDCWVTLPPPISAEATITGVRIPESPPFLAIEVSPAFDPENPGWAGICRARFKVGSDGNAAFEVPAPGRYRVDLWLDVAPQETFR